MTSGGVSNKKAENKDTSSRNLKEELAGGDSSRVKVKRSPDKSRSKFDASKRAPNSSNRSYNSSSQAQPSGIPLICSLKPQYMSIFPSVDILCFSDSFSN